MSYDLGLMNPRTGQAYELTERHHMRGGTYAIGGTPYAEINITYNYSNHFENVFAPVRSSHEYARDGMLHGIRSIYGMTGAESILVLESAILKLGDDTGDDYWKSTEGNAKASLRQCLALARMCPDGVWDGD